MTMTMTVASLIPKPMRPKSPFLPHSLNSRRIFKSEQDPSVGAPTLVDQFDPTIPIERAVSPPSSWYTDPSFAQELDSVFYRGWLAVGYTEQIRNPGDFFTGRLGNVAFVVCRDEHGKLQAFHNVCRHHASILAYGSGRKLCFVCPDHGWTYGLDGALLKATRITGIQNFNKHGRIGLAMGKQATEVVKESSDIIVLDGNFATVAKGFRWGRSMHEKVLRVMQQQLTANSVAVTINCLAAVNYRHIPLNAVQFVWVNVIIFGLGPLVLATESPADDLMNVPPID